jgi:hypothetical protein
LVDQQRSIAIYRQGVEDGRRSGYACATQALFKSWLVATVVSAVVMVIAPGEKDWRTIIATTGTGGSVGFFAAWVIDKSRSR